MYVNENHKKASWSGLCQKTAIKMLSLYVV